MSLQTRLTALAQAVGADIKDIKIGRDPDYRKMMGTGAQAGPSNGATWVYNATNSCYLDLPAGTWRVESGMMLYSNVADYYSLGLYNETDAVNFALSSIEQCYVGGSTSIPLTNVKGSTVVTVTKLTRVRILVVPSGASTATVAPQSTHGVCCLEAFRVGSGAQGIQGPQGIPGGNPAVGAATQISLVNPQRVTDVSTAIPEFTLPITVTGNYKVGATLDVILYAAGSVMLIGTLKKNGVTIFPQMVYQPNNALDIRVPVSQDWVLPLVAGDVLTFWVQKSTSAIVIDISNLHSSLYAYNTGGPKGDKGDTGGIDSYTTFNWDTALVPGFYRSSNDGGMTPTLNGPGDTLNPPAQAGMVAVHQGGSLVQRVWDLDFQIPYTRYKQGSTWSAWVADVRKPRIDPELSIGGAAAVEGDERYFQTAAMKTLGIIWKFRYDKTAPSGKPSWVFVGGASLTTAPAGSLQTATNSPTVVTGAPTFTATLDGEYLIRIEGLIQQYGAGPAQGNLSWGKNGTQQPVGLLSTIGQATYDGVTVSGERLLTLAEGDVVSVMCNGGNAVSIMYNSIVLGVLPRRVVL